ncbi:SDR family oxidoreductase [Chroococcidiopsidales cyanobacterium LEGE 13417]|nr:SDR family oxidoreductase [Chroococcidiopsidales cyanobacterium LEGE 13417]
MNELKDKVALVTGGSTGIGQATAIAFAQAGAKVAIASRTPAAGEKTVSQIKAAGGDAVFIKTDVTQASEVEALVDKTVSIYGRLDCAFNNAGIEGKLGAIVDETEDNWHSVIDANMKSVWLSMKYEIAHMLKNGGGAIVNNASVVGLIAMPNVATYTASKHGVVGLTKAAALECAKAGIRVNAVAPAVIQTPMLDRFVGGSQEGIAAFGDRHPIGRVGKPEEIAAAVLWLTSNAASFVTGQTLAVDGGYTVQ